MSLKAMSAVWECRDLSSSQKLVSLYISDKVSEDNDYRFFGGKNRCIEKTKLTRNAVYSAFKDLESKGFITRVGSREDGRIEYVFNIEKYINPEESESTEGVSKSRQGGVSKSRQGGCIDIEIQTQELITQVKTKDITPIVPLEKKKVLSIDDLRSSNPLAIPVDMLDDWMTIRKTKRAPITPRVWDRLNKQLNKCLDNGLSVTECFETMIERGWSTINHEWMRQTSNSKTSDHTSTAWADDLLKQQAKGLL